MTRMQNSQVAGQVEFLRNSGKRKRVLWEGVGLAVSIAAIVGLGSQPKLLQQVQAGEYFTEETTSAAVDVVHGWTHTEGDFQISVTNSNRSNLSVPLEVEGAQSCGLAAFTLSDGTNLSIGSLDQACTISLFPYLDRLINQQVQTLLLTVDNQLVEIPTTADDRLALARVADQSRDVYLLFQEEVAKTVAFYTAERSQAAAPSAPASNPPASAIATPATADTSTQQAPTPSEVPTPPSPPAADPSSSSSNVPTEQAPTSSEAPSSPPAANLPPETPPTPSPVAASPVSQTELVIVGDIEEEAAPTGGSRITVNAVNNSQRTALSAQARFEFLSNQQVVDSRVVAFDPNDVPPGASARAQVLKTEENWDTVRVSFVWERPVQP
ncbi:MAG: hypothetical protein AB4040_03640 [Synechococcus sp.]